MFIIFTFLFLTFVLPFSTYIFRTATPSGIFRKFSTNPLGLFPKPLPDFIRQQRRSFLLLLSIQPRQRLLHIRPGSISFPVLLVPRFEHLHPLFVIPVLLGLLDLDVGPCARKYSRGLGVVLLRGLGVRARVPVGVKDDDSVGSGEVDPQPPDLG